MTSPVRIRLAGRQTRLKFGPTPGMKEPVTGGRLSAGSKAPRSLPEAILGLIRIAAAVLPRPSSNPGSVSASSSRVPLPVLIRGHQPQSWFAAAFRKLFQQAGSGFTEGKHRLVSSPVHNWEPSERDGAWANGNGAGLHQEGTGA